MKHQILKTYFKKRKEASVLYRELFYIQQIEISCYDFLKGLNEKKYEKLVVEMERVRKELEWKFEYEEKNKFIEAGLFDEDVYYNPFEWLARYELLIRKELKGKMFMICFQSGSLTLWEVFLFGVSFFLYFFLFI